MQWVDIGNCWTVFKLQHNPVANYIHYRSSFELFGTPYYMCETLLLYSPYKQCHQWLVWRSWWVRLVKMPWRDGSRWQKNPWGFKSRMFSWWSLAYSRNEGVRVTATLRKYIECWVVESFLEIRYWNENFTQWDKLKVLFNGEVELENMVPRNKTCSLLLHLSRYFMSCSRWKTS